MSSSHHLERPDGARGSSNVLAASSSSVNSGALDIASKVPPEGFPSSSRHASHPVRHRSNSYASSGGLSSPRSCASNFSYASQNTTASSVRSVIDLGDMDKFYQSGVGNTLSSSTTPRSSAGTDSHLSLEMQKFFQAYGASAVARGSFNENGSYTSGSTTVRSSDLAHLRASDMGTYFRQSSASMRRSGGEPHNELRHSYVANSRRSETNLRFGRQPQYPGKISRVSESNVFYRRSSTTISYVPEAERSEDVVLAHRMSLDDGQRVSLHAIL